MRIHRLSVRAFGPFLDEVEVDVDALGADGLFLLHGETGAGKTTLLDAIAFALYGRVPGARGDEPPRRLRCDRADPATSTQVTLEATIAGRRLVITRSPEYEREKKSGTGTTVQKAKVTLRWVGARPEDGPALDLTSAREVGEVILGLLGMSAEQFFQVVLLAQGEFARFLRSGTADREVLLEKLFDTIRFAHLEAAFAEQRKLARAAADEADAVAARELARVVEAAGIEEQPDEADAGWLARVRAGVAAEAEQAGLAAAAARSARDRATRALAAGEQRDRLVAQLLELRAEKSRLDAQAGAQQTLAAALADAEGAAGVVTADRVVRAAESVQRDAAQAVPVARGLVPERYRPALGAAGTHELEVDSALFSVDEDGSAHVSVADPVILRRAADGLRDDAGALATLLELEVEQARDEDAAGSLRAEAAACEEQLAALDADLAEAPERGRAIEREILSLRGPAGREQEHVLAASAADEICRAAATLPELQTLLGGAIGAHRDAVDDHQRARDERQGLVDRRIAGMAAELARGLRDGEPCAVCGSTSHPAPATAADEPVDPAAIDAATVRERQAETARAEAEQAVAAAQTAVTVATAAARDHDLAGAQALADAARAELQASRAAAVRLPKAETRLAAFAAGQTDLLASRARLVAQLAGFRARVSELERALASRARRLAAAAGGFASVAENRDRLLAAAAGLDGWAQAAEEADRADRAVRTARQEREKAVADAGFGSLQEALQAAALDVPAARDALSRHAEQVAAVTSQLQRADLQLDGEILPVDVGALALLAATAQAADEVATARQLVADQRYRQTEAAAIRLDGAWQRREPLARKATWVAALADVIAGRGQNARSLSLRSYVLALKLRQVAVVAGRRLAAMSSGRYSFVHSDEPESHGRSGGLGLDILDAYSGRVRPARTLSGGESFLASLALALGLADVVAAESGGRMLDTIFIDEGFGSLDSDTLDLVMQTLDELRAGGRVVGVVSHVDEMRQRIPSRLRVRKTPTGSAVEVTTLAGC